MELLPEGNYGWSFYPSTSREDPRWTWKRRLIIVDPRLELLKSQYRVQMKFLLHTEFSVLIWQYLELLSVIVSTTAECYVTGAGCQHPNFYHIPIRENIRVFSKGCLS